MILASKVKELLAFDVNEINRILRQSGYTDQYTRSEFLGISNSGDFCFHVVSWDEYEGTEVDGKVWVRQNGFGEFEADY